MYSHLSRRDFLQSIGGGLAVLLSADFAGEAQESGRSGRNSRPLPQNIAAWLHIEPSGAITAFTGKVEVGQNARTSLTQCVADELRCSPELVRLVMGDTSLVPWDAGTYGSLTTPIMVPQLRKIASTAREMLIDCAAQQWSLDRANLKARGGFVSSADSKRKASYGELSAKVNWAAAVGTDGHVTPPADWEVVGKSLPKVNAREIVCGKHRYTSDLRVDNMLFGRVLRPPSFGAKLISADTDAAAKMPGVKVVRDGDFVGVAARDEAVAQKALAAINARWEQKPQGMNGSNSELFRTLTDMAKAQNTNGSAPSGDHQLQSVYTVAYIAHVPLEPRCAVARFSADGITVQTGTQRPFGVRDELAKTFQLPESKVRVAVPDTGSGYGGKHTGEYAVEAARLAKGAGAPVKSMWTREEEFTWAYFRPAGSIAVRSAVSLDGILQGWEAHNNMSGPSGLPTPYQVPSEAHRYHEVDGPLSDGSYRGLASTANHFARESHMDELAAAAKMDPLDFRLKNLKNDRLRTVLQAAADKFEWSKLKSSANRGYGLACGTEKGGYLGCCVEVSIGAAKQVRVDRVVTAWDCGAIINPEQLKNQVEGAIMMGLGGALFESIEFANGQIWNPRLSEYRVPRFSDAPSIELVLIDRKDVPSAGAGEIPIVGIAPAIANALHSATGVRVRSLPLIPAFQAS